MKLFLLGGGFEALGADLFSFSFDFFALKIDGKLSKGFDLGMADLVAGLTPASANITDSRHNFKL